MRKIKQDYLIKSSLGKVWQALVDPKEIEKWGGGSAKMEGTKGFKFSLWGGSIFGINTEVVRNKKLVQEWYSESENQKWEKPSIVTFLLSEEKDKVKVALVQDRVPDEDFDDIKNGWEEYYLGPLKSYLEKIKNSY